MLASAYGWKNRYRVSVFEFCVQAIHCVDVFAVYKKREERLHFAPLVVDVFSEFFAVPVS